MPVKAFVLAALIWQGDVTDAATGARDNLMPAVVNTGMYFPDPSDCDDMAARLNSQRPGAVVRPLYFCRGNGV